MKKWLLVTSLFFCVISAQAKTIYPTLILDSVKTIKTSEKYGDEIYWVITEFKSSGKNIQYTIPKYPVHWPAKAADNIKNIQLWRSRIPTGQSTIVYLELVEHDAPPFNIDDSIGSLRLHIKNDSGQIKVDWEKSENVKRSEAKQNGQMVENLTFHGEGGEYLVKMHFATTRAKDYRPIKSQHNHRIKLR